MSRGPGRIERAIGELLAANPDASFTIIEVAKHCYPDAAPIEKRHTVSVLRASRNVVRRDPDWAMRWSSNHGCPYHFVNHASLKSLCISRLRDRPWGEKYLEAVISGSLSPEEIYSRHLTGSADGDVEAVELHIAKRTGNVAGAAELQAKRDAQQAQRMAIVRELMR
jgi:hypothetical protein